jgi:hypothetical protein
MNTKRRLHDGIVGALIALGGGLALWVDPAWVWLPAILGIAMVQSAFTGFCPVYFFLERLGFSDAPRRAT